MKGFLISCALLVVISASTARAAITPSGDVIPADPSTWDSSTTGYIGDTSAGTLTVDGGSGLLSLYGYIGNNSGSTGTVTVDGAGSTWSNISELYVGNSGSGTLNITNGGTVSNNYCYIGNNSGSTGTVTVDGAGSTWTNYGSLYLGFYGGSGTLNITNGGAVSSSYGDTYIGCYSGSAGTVTVDGAGSTWTNYGDLYLGFYGGSGTLNITNGCVIFVTGTTYVGSDPSSTGTINFGANGGTLTTGSLFASPSQLLGTGTINACGLVSDIDLVFDSTHGLTQTITLNSLTDQNVTVNLDMSIADNNGALGAGYQGVGSLTIQDGIAVTSTNGYLGYKSGSTGTATVSGVGSTWTNSGDSMSATTATEISRSPMAAPSAIPTA